eukprot:8548754-Lingulodinium_polyedra.AAC.1
MVRTEVDTRGKSTASWEQKRGGPVVKVQGHHLEDMACTSSQSAPGIEGRTGVLTCSSMKPTRWGDWEAYKKR